MSLNFSLLCLGGAETNYQKLFFREAPFFKCVVSIWALGGWFVALFSPLCRGCAVLPWVRFSHEFSFWKILRRIFSFASGVLEFLAMNPYRSLFLNYVAIPILVTSIFFETTLFSSGYYPITEAVVRKPS